MKKKFADLTLELQKGNIVEQNDISAIVNAANAELHTGSGVAGAIHNAAGKELEIACRSLAPINPGQAVITDAFKLPNDYVIHTLGPVYGRNHPGAKLLEACYRNSLILADRNKISSIAFPAISTGVFGYPVDKAALIALKTISETAVDLNNVKLVRLVLWSDSDYTIFSETLENI